MKHLFTLSILALLTLTGIAQSQPTERRITDIQGRQLDGTILERSGDSIRFERTSDKKQFTLPLAQLSAPDQEFIRSLPVADGNAAVEKPANGNESQWKTTIEPGKRVFLALPFEKQEAGGVCASASTLNILQFIDPELKLSQRELFALFNDKRSGASPTQVILALKTLGYDATRLTVDGIPKNELVFTIQESLDKGIPVVAAKKGHAMTLIGYDKQKETLTIWDQRMPNMKKRDDLPLGAQELSEAAFRGRIEDVLILKPVNSKQPGHQLASKGETHLHQIHNANSSAESLEEFLEHAAAPRISVELRKGHQVFIPDEKGFTEITREPVKNDWPVRGTENQTMPERAIFDLLVESQGVFFSVRSKSDITKLP